MSKLFEEFRNNVFCRRTVNQDKAKELWELIKCFQDVNPKIFMSTSDIQQFEIEWSHYLMGELTPEEFGTVFKKHIQKYYETMDI